MGMMKEIDEKSHLREDEYCEQKFLGGNEQTLN